jgi:hypothetical protein
MGMWHQGHISRTKKRSFGFVLLGFSGFRFRVFRFGVFGIGRENPNGQKKGKSECCCHCVGEKLQGSVFVFEVQQETHRSLIHIEPIVVTNSQ